MEQFKATSETTLPKRKRLQRVKIESGIERKILRLNRSPPTVHFDGILFRDKMNWMEVS